MDVKEYQCGVGGLSSAALALGCEFILYRWGGAYCRLNTAIVFTVS